MKHKTVIAIICVLSGILFSGCENTKKLYKDTGLFAATFVEVTSPDKKSAKIVFSKMEELEAIFNIFDPDSDISRLNQSAGIKPVRVSTELIKLIEISRILYKETNGAFNPAAGKIFGLWKTAIKNNAARYIPGDEKIKKLLKSATMDSVKVEPKNQTVFVTDKNTRLDLGGIAKGFMVAEAVQALKNTGIDSALINAGGDIYALGLKDERGWKIGIRNPQIKSQILETIQVKDTAIATSGDYEQSITYEGREYSHIINPATGYPVENNTKSVTVITPNPTEADAFATALSVMGKERIGNFVKTRTDKLTVFIIEEVDGRLSISKMTNYPADLPPHRR